MNRRAANALCQCLLRVRWVAGALLPELSLAHQALLDAPEALISAVRHGRQGFGQSLAERVKLLSPHHHPHELAELSLEASHSSLAGSSHRENGRAAVDIGDTHHPALVAKSVYRQGNSWLGDCRRGGDDACALRPFAQVEHHSVLRHTDIRTARSLLEFPVDRDNRANSQE